MAEFKDYYEILQISPGAEPETIQRVYRLLAQRYHPDNRDTGNEDRFRIVHEAYQVLSEPVSRAQYDVEYHSNQTQRWKVFDTQVAADGFDAEKNLRHGILSLLYSKRRADPSNAGISLLDIEVLIGRPREHLEFTLWFLKEKDLVRRTDDNLFMITVDGCETVEQAGMGAQLQKLLDRPKRRDASSNNES